MFQADDSVHIKVDGPVQLSSFDMVTDRPYMKIWDFDARTKYYDTNIVPTFNKEKNAWEVEVMFWPVDGSLYLDDTKEKPYTSVVIDFDPRKWQFMLSGGRYETRILAYQIPENKEY